jgi:hypothetical protein
MRRHAEIDDSKRKKSCQSSPRIWPLDVCAWGVGNPLVGGKQARIKNLPNPSPSWRAEATRPFQHRRNPLPLLPAPNPRFHSLIRRSSLGSEARNGSGPVSAPLQSRFSPSIVWDFGRLARPRVASLPPCGPFRRMRKFGRDRGCVLK